MSTAVAPMIQMSPEEVALLTGDLSKLSEPQRADLLIRVCKSVGLNPLTKPFMYIVLNAKLTMYTTANATDQLRRLHNVSTAIVSRERIDDVYVVTARCTLPNGRVEERIGAVTIGNLKGDALCNALMKAETKAVRRCTLASCGMGFLDESELETIPNVQAWQERTDRTTGEITSRPATPARGPLLAAPGPDVQYEQWPPKPGPVAQDDGALPATPKMYKVLVDLISQARRLGENIGDPSPSMNVAQARELKAFLEGVIESAMLGTPPEPVEVG